MTRSHVLFALLSLAAYAGCTSARPRDPGPEPGADAGAPAPLAVDAGDPAPSATDAGPGCTDECAPGTAPRCGGPGYQACERGPDGCMRWGDVTACGDGQTCEAGVCRGDGCPGGCCPRCDGTSCGPGSDGCGGRAAAARGWCAATRTRAARPRTAPAPAVGS